MNIRELLNNLGVQFKEHGQSPHVTTGWVGVQCPFCGIGTGKYGLGFHVRSLRVSCWKCGSHRLGDALAACTNRPLREIMPLLPGVDPDPQANDQRPSGRFAPPFGVGSMTEPHRRYLERRGFNPDAIARDWGVQGIGDTVGLKWRLFIPVVLCGKPVSWTTRALGSKIEPRYISASPEYESRPIHSCLYGEDKVRHSVVIVEGPTDVWRIGPGAVATFGLKVTQDQIARLCKYPIRVVAFDNDLTAQRLADELSDQLSVMPGDTYVVRMHGKDPATSTEEEVAELRERFLTQ